MYTHKIITGFIQYCLTLILLLPCLGQAQIIRGRVVDEQTNANIAYANIGVLRGERGTVSNEQGYFYLDLADVSKDATLRFSFIGYQPKDIYISEFSDSCSMFCNIQMTPQVLQMQEVVVYSKEFVEKVVGNPNPFRNASAGFENDSLGYEMGIRVRIKKRPTILKELRLHGLTTSYDTVFYRLNVYEMDGGSPGRNILKQPIYITLTDFKGVQQEEINGVIYEGTPGEERTIDLTPYHIVVQDNFLIALEYVRELGEGDLQLNTGFLSGKVFFRKTSQAEWHSMPLGLGMSVLIRYEK